MLHAAWQAIRFGASGVYVGCALLNPFALIMQGVDNLCQIGGEAIRLLLHKLTRTVSATLVV